MVFNGFAKKRRKKSEKKKTKREKKEKEKRDTYILPLLQEKNISLDFPVGKSGFGVRGVCTKQKQEYLSTRTSGNLGGGHAIIPLLPFKEKFVKTEKINLFYQKIGN